jgi:hypothetical protein
MKFSIGQKVRKTIGVPVYVQWDDGTKGWIQEGVAHVYR